MNSNSKPSNPRVGEGATIYHYSDRDAATVVRVSPSGSTAWIQEDSAKRADSNGQSDQQTYTYSPNTDAQIQKVVKTKTGWKIAGKTSRVVFGYRRAYHDFSF